MATPHISAQDDAFAESILLPGDPLRARYIAEGFLEDVTEVTAVRNMLGFTGTYKGIPVSTMGTGMGIPSASIYVTELLRFYGVRRLIRVGSCGGISTDVKMRDVILAIGAGTDSLTNRTRYNGWDYAPTANFELLRAAADAASDLNIQTHVGNLHSSDLFYNTYTDSLKFWQRMGVLAVEMETAAIYSLAAEAGAQALSIVTVSDHLVTEEQTSSEERERTFDQMVRIALEAIHKLEQ
ncbi:MAG: purine-nucleoside phosphorylase [bacterium]|nr:purine-nucleoside phosphorylase [bacterium]